MAETGFADPAAFQKALWWYDALPTYLAMPPVIAGGVANLWPGFFLKPRPGVPQQIHLGTVKIPTLYGCGKKVPVP